MDGMEEKQLPSNSSYIVLNRCIDDENNDTLNFPNFQLHQEHLMKMSDIPQMPKDTQVILPETVEEVKSPTVDIEKRLSDLLSENMSLKETLHQNNLAMKQQFNTLCLWQEEVLKVHQSHKERFDETKQLIVKLVAENKDLRSQNEKHEEKSDVKQLELEKEDLVKQLQDTESKLNQMMIKVNKKRCQLPSTKEKELGSIVEMLTERLEIAERARRQLEIDVERLTAQKARLEQKLSMKGCLQMANPEKSKVVILGNPPYALLKEIKDYLLQNQKRLPSHLTKIPDSDDDVADQNTPPEILHLKKLLVEVHEDNCKLKHYLKVITSEYEKQMSLQSNVCNEVKITKQAYPEHPKNKEETEALDILVAKLMSKDEELSFKSEQIDALKCRLKMLEEENEAVQILKAQVAVYQTDFNIERKNREDLAAEREKLLSDMRQLLKQNKHLTEELARLQGPNCSNVKTGNMESSTNVSSLELDEEIGDLVCPNPECSMRFSRFEPLQVHVEQCLKLTD